MSLFKREWSSTVTKAEFNVRRLERRARTSWLAPPTASPTLEPHPEALRPQSVPNIEPAPMAKARSERPPEMRPAVDEAAAAPHPPTIHAAFIVNHGQARLTELIDRLGTSIDQLAGERVRVLGRAERDLVELSAAIARRVVGRELTVDPSLLAELASEGIDALGPKERIVVRLGEIDDDAAFEAIRARLTARAPQCQVIRDPSLPRGGCVVETEYGSVDESLEERLGNVMSALSAIPSEVAKP